MADEFCLKMPEFHVTFKDLLHAVNLRHGTDGFTSPPKEGELRIFSPWKIQRLRSGLNPWTWVPKASTLPLDHRSRYTTYLPEIQINEDTHICLRYAKWRHFRRKPSRKFCRSLQYIPHENATPSPTTKPTVGQRNESSSLILQGLGTETLCEIWRSHVTQCGDYSLHAKKGINKAPLQREEFSVIPCQSVFHWWSIHKAHLTSPSDVRSFQPVIKLQNHRTQVWLHLRFATANINHFDQNIFRCKSAYWNETDRNIYVLQQDTQYLMINFIHNIQ